MNLLGLPLDILNLVNENLDLISLIHLASTCQTMHNLLRPEPFIWLIQNPQDTTSAKDHAIRESSHLMRCHSLHELFHEHNLEYDYTLLLEYGASFKPVRYWGLLHEVFYVYGPGEMLDFLLSNGVSLHCVGGPLGSNTNSKGINILLEEEFLGKRRIGRIEFLFRHGADLRDVPRGLENLVNRLIRSGAEWKWIEMVMEKGGSLRSVPAELEGELKRIYSREGFSDRVKFLLRRVPDSVNILLEYTLLKWEFVDEVDTLLSEVPSFRQVVSTGSGEDDHGLLVRAVLEKDADLSLTDETGWTPLFRAAALGYTEIVRCLVGKGAALDDGDRDGRTPLHAAVLGGRNETIALLLDAGADPRIADKSRETTPLQAAAFNGHLEATRILAARSDLDHTNARGWTALFFAAYYGFVEIAMVLLNAGANPYIAERDGLTSIHAAAAGGHVEMVLLFIDRGIEPETAAVGPKNRGETPLHTAVSSGRFKVVKVLIEHGAKLTTVRDDGYTGVDLAAVLGYVELVRFMRGSAADSVTDDGKTAMHWACHNGQLDVVKFLIEHGADPGVEDNEKITPIYFAARSGHIDVLRFLIEQGVDADVANRHGRTPLFTAAVAGYPDLVRILIDQHARVDPEADDGNRPLYLAAVGGHLDVVRILIDNHADVNARAPDGMAALHLACTFDTLAMVELLVENGADVNAATMDGLTPLHAAIVVDSLDIMRYLIDHGSDLNATAMRGSTALHESASCGRWHATKLIIQAKADLSARDHTGCTPLCCASRNGKLETVKLLTDELASAGTGLSSTTPQDDFHRTPLHWAIYRRHPDVASFLIAQGIDTTVVDGYGRTALDWARINHDTFHGILSTNHQSGPEDTQTQMQILQHSIARLAHDILNTTTIKTPAANFHNLGHCLVLLQDQISARFSFMHQIATFTGSDELMHKMPCENRAKGSGCDPRRFVCMVCPELMLCASCINSLPGCRGHKLLSIPGPADEVMRDWEAGKVPGDVREWLEGLVERFG